MLYSIFQCVLTATNSPQNCITITVQAKLLKTLEAAKEVKVEVLRCTLFQFKRNLLTVKIPDITEFF